MVKKKEEALETSAPRITLDDSLLKDIKDALVSLSDRVGALEAKPEPAKTPEVVAPVVDSKFPIPVDYQDAVDTILNKHFKIELTYPTDQAAFEFTIFVPEKYSNAGKPHWDMYGCDRRTRVIQNALGLLGVREWCTKVYENFSAETKAAITMDRQAL